MQNLLLLILLSTAGLGLFVQAQAAEGDSNLGPPALNLGHGRQQVTLDKRHSQGDEKDVVKNTVSGQCVIVAGNGNLEDSLCNNVTLKLESAPDQPTYVARTGVNGTFSFEVPAHGVYRIGVTSRFYEVVSPTEPVSMTKPVHLQLKLK